MEDIIVRLEQIEKSINAINETLQSQSLINTTVHRLSAQKTDTDLKVIYLENKKLMTDTKWSSISDMIDALNIFNKCFEEEFTKNGGEIPFWYKIEKCRINILENVTKGSNKSMNI